MGLPADFDKSLDSIAADIPDEYRRKLLLDIKPDAFSAAFASSEQQRYEIYKNLVARFLDEHLARGGFRLLSADSFTRAAEPVRPGQAIGPGTPYVLYPLLGTIDVLVRNHGYISILCCSFRFSGFC